MLGRKAMTIPVEAETALFNRGNLSAGLYFYILRSEKGLPLSTGKVILE
jgi:hypothetical protein